MLVNEGGFIKLLRDKTDGITRSVSFSESRSCSHCTVQTSAPDPELDPGRPKQSPKKEKKLEISLLEELSQ